MRFAFPRFRDTRQHVPSPSVAAYLEDPKVLAGLASQAVAGQLPLFSWPSALFKVPKLPKLPKLPSVGKTTLTSVEYVALGVAVVLGGVVFGLKSGLVGSRSGQGASAIAVGATKAPAGTAVVGGGGGGGKQGVAAVGGKLSTLSVPSGVQLSRDVVRHIVEQWLVRLLLLCICF